jgi:hypothetical protein
MKRLILLLTIYVCILESVQGQKKFFIEASGNSGLPWIKQAEYKPVKGISIHAGRQFEVSKLFIEPAIGLSWIQFVPLIDYYEFTMNRDHLYLYIPLKINYPVYKYRVFLGAGISANVLAGSRHRWWGSGSNDGISNLYMDSNVNLSYQLTPDWVITSAYHQGLTPVYDHYIRISENWKSNRITLGAKYVFTSLIKRKKQADPTFVCKF